MRKKWTGMQVDQEENIKKSDKIRTPKALDHFIFYPFYLLSGGS